MREWLALGLAGMIGMMAAGQSSPPSSTAEERQKAGDAFALMREQWARNLHDKLIDASVAEYAADAEFIDPGGSRVRGTTALHKLFETVTAMYDSDLTFDSQRVELSGDLAYDSGTYRETLIVRATAKTQHSNGSYLTIYRRGKNGAWLIAEQVWAGAISDKPVVARYRDGIRSSSRAIFRAVRAGMLSQVSIDSLGLGI